MSLRQNKYTKFKLSKPWGYFPPDVDKAIDTYESTLGKINSALAEQVQLNTRLKERIKKLEDELRAMHIEMSSIELPDTEELTESVVLQEFRNYPNGPSMPMRTAEDNPREESGIVDIAVGEDDEEFLMKTRDAALDGSYEEDDGEQEATDILSMGPRRKQHMQNQVQNQVQQQQNQYKGLKLGGNSNSIHSQNFNGQMNVAGNTNANAPSNGSFNQNFGFSDEEDDGDSGFNIVT